MKFTYRGINYENLPQPEITSGEIEGKYRGVDWKREYPRHIPVPQPVLGLQYRGTSYCTGHPLDIEASQLRQKYSVTPSVASTAQNEAKSTHNNRKQLVAELNNTHRSNIRSSLEHRLQAARAKGDENLIRILQQEAKQLT